MGNETFLYFAYGSNLLTERIRINNPSARFKSVGFLNDHKLDFNNRSKVEVYNKENNNSLEIFIFRSGEELWPLWCQMMVRESGESCGH